MEKSACLLIVWGLLLSVVSGCAPASQAAVKQEAPPQNSIVTAIPAPKTENPRPTPQANRPPSAPTPSPAATQVQPAEVRYSDRGYTIFGDWYSEIAVSPAAWQPGQKVNISATLKVAESHLGGLSAAGIDAEGFILLITAERTFDADGWLRLSSDERMSTLLTPTGLAIEGGIQGAVTNRFGYDFRTPVDEFLTVPLASAQYQPGQKQAVFKAEVALPDDLPPGIYRVRFDYGVVAKKRNYNLNGEAFARRPFFQGRPTESHLYSPPIRASGKHVSGRWVDASAIQPRIPWIILGNYNSNGYRGVVADEDKSRFALSVRNIIPDDVILPLYDDTNKNKLAYSLEPIFPADTIEDRSNISWDYTRGEVSIQVTGPDGKTIDLGTAPFVGMMGGFTHTTRRPAFTAWRPQIYGQYTVKVTGWTADIWGNRYEGGGTYHFWIAKRMTLATATFQGVSYPVGSRYGRDLGFAPAVPADVEVTATFYPGSDPGQARTVTYSGKASPGGIYGAAQGSKPLVLDAPGEYSAHILAKYTDPEGHLWVSTMRHAGVVYAEDSPIIAHGKKVTIKGKMVDRGETNFEGWVDTATDTNHLAHINYPYQAGDVLLIASDGQGANKIEPVLTYETRDKPAPYDPRLQTIGTTNLKIKTSNGYSPHLFPEYITDWAYYYAAAPRPGFMSRFLVGEDGVRAPYWPTSPNSFGGQINTTANGDLPGDIYRLIGGVVLREKGKAPAYAGYTSSAFILPRGSDNNRVIAAGAEDLIGSDGSRARLFLVGTRPGMVYETGTAFAAAVQIDPVLPATVKFTLEYPDGRRVSTEGPADKFGTWVGRDRWTLDLPGVYRFNLEADWQGFKGRMPGLPRSGGEIYVVEKERPAGLAGLKLTLPNQSVFTPSGTLTINGTSTAQTVYYAAVIPGSVVTQGALSVSGGKFSYRFDPSAINQTTPTYDITNRVTGRPELGDVVHLTFFAKESYPGGATYHSFVRVIIRGNKVISVY